MRRARCSQPAAGPRSGADRPSWCPSYSVLRSVLPCREGDAVVAREDPRAVHEDAAAAQAGPQGLVVAELDQRGVLLDPRADEHPRLGVGALAVRLDAGAGVAP